MRAALQLHEGRRRGNVLDGSTDQGPVDRQARARHGQHDEQPDGGMLYLRQEQGTQEEEAAISLGFSRNQTTVVRFP